MFVVAIGTDYNILMTTRRLQGVAALLREAQHRSERTGALMDERSLAVMWLDRGTLKQKACARSLWPLTHSPFWMTRAE